MFSETKLIMDNVTESLMTWLQTFHVSAPHKTVEELSDGVALAQLLTQIDPEYFDRIWYSKVKTDVGNNWRLKVSNLKKILKGIMDFYSEVLCQQLIDFKFPDVNAIAECADGNEMGRLLQLILGCAVNCAKKQEYIQVIMGLEEDVQHVVMNAIQELITMTKEAPPSYSGETFSDLNEQLKAMVEELRLTKEAKEQITQRCHELDMQVTMLQEEKTNLLSDNEKLQEKLNQIESLEDPSTIAGRRFHQSQQKVEALQRDIFNLELARDDYKIKVEHQEKDILDLQQKNEDLQRLADQAKSLNDELDVLRHTSDKIGQYEATIETYKKKLEDLGDLKRQVKLLEEKNTHYMQRNIELEEELKKQGALRTQVDSYKKQVHELHGRLSEETRKAEKAVFENKKLQEKFASLLTEKERLLSDRNALKETIEEMQCMQLQKETDIQNGGSRTAGTLSDSEMLEAVPPEIKEKLIRLQHENKMLKLNQTTSENQQVTLLKTMLEDSQSRQNELETEVRLLNQRNLELESHIQDLQDSHVAVTSQEESELKHRLNSLAKKNKEVESELQRKQTMVEALETQLESSGQKCNKLGEMLDRKGEEMRAMEERYQKYLDKAKNVIRSLDHKNISPTGSEVISLRNQLQEKDRHISQLKDEMDLMKAQWEKEEKLITTAFYNYGAILHRKTAEERMLQAASGQSFLARQRQATTKRHNMPGVQSSEFFD